MLKEKHWGTRFLVVHLSVQRVSLYLSREPLSIQGISRPAVISLTTMYHGVNYVQVIGTLRSVLFIALTLTNFFEVWLEENMKKSRCWFSDSWKMFKNYFLSLKCAKIIVFKILKLVHVYICVYKIQNIFNIHATYIIQS